MTRMYLLDFIAAGTLAIIVMMIWTMFTNRQRRAEHDENRDTKLKDTVLDRTLHDDTDRVRLRDD